MSGRANPSEQRAHIRKGRWEYSSLAVGGLLEAPCVVMEASEGGASLRLREPVAFSPGAPGVIVIGNRTRSGEIVWRAGDCAGLRFDKP